jgi:O-antigen ligase
MMTTACSFANTNIRRPILLSAALISVTALNVALFDLRLVAVLYLIPWFILLFYRHPILLLGLWPVISLVEVFMGFNPLRTSSVRILPMDPVYFFTIAHLAVCAFMHPKKTIRILKESPFLMIFVGMVALSIVLYTPVYGQSAVGEARKFYFFFLFPLLAMVTIKETGDLRRLLLVVVATALVISVVAFTRAAMAGSIVRVLDAEMTLILGLTAFGLLLLRINRVRLINPPVDTALLCVFSFVVVASSQRSVMLGVGVGSILLLWLYRHRAVFMFKASMAIASIVVGITVAVIVFPEAGSKLTGKLAGLLNPSSDKTASWRIKGWQAHLETVFEGNPLVGEGLGSYYSWGSGRSEVINSPHNAYIQLMLKFGLLGLLIYGLLLVEFFRKTLSVRKKLPSGPMRAFVEMGVVCFGAGHGYMLGYGFQPIMLIFLGMALSTVKLSQQTLRDDRTSRIRDPRSDLKTWSVSMPGPSGAIP